MIVGVIGPVSDDCQMVIDLLTEDSVFQVVDGIEVIRRMDRKSISSITSKDYHKRYFLASLENAFGSCIFTGNLILSPSICEWILNNGGKIIIVSRDDLNSYDSSVLQRTGSYWEDPAIQRYELVNRFKRLYEDLSSKFGTESVFKIDLSDENSEDLLRLVEQSQSWKPSNQSGVDFDELLKIVVRKGDNTMTMEESIKRAMQELGVDLGDDTGSMPVSESVKKPTEMKKSASKRMVEIEVPVEQSTKKSEPSEEQLDELDGQLSIEDLDSGTAKENDNDDESIFVKLTDTTMALLIPEGLHLETQVIGGETFKVATVSIPDFHNHKLQELTIDKFTSSEEGPVEPKKPVEVSVIHAPGDSLEELRQEKARLDAEIKKYRAEGDLDTVNALRKQRRIIRGKINSLK